MKEKSKKIKIEKVEKRDDKKWWNKKGSKIIIDK